MASEKVTVEQAVQKLSEADTNNNARLIALERKLDEIHFNLLEQSKNINMNLPDEITNVQEKMIDQIENVQRKAKEWQDTTTFKLEEKQQQWEQLTNNIRDMRTEVEKMREAMEVTASRTNYHNQRIEENGSTPSIQRHSPTLNEFFDNGQSDHHNITEHGYHVDSNTRKSSPIEYISPTTHTIVIPPPTAIPTFNGKISENPHQFLIRVKEYAETINHWDDRLLLHGISQFLRDTALEWYCQLRTTNRCPQTWVEFKIIFLNQFNSPIRRARQEQQWKNCKQEENETINEFIVRLRALWQEQKPNETENDLIRHLMCKMKNNLLTMVGISRCESLDEIISEAQRVEEILYQRNKLTYRSDYHNSQQNDRSAISMFDNQYHHERQAQSNNRGGATSNRNGNYYVTPRQSHYSTQTTINRWNIHPSNAAECYSCGRKGHFRRNCPSRYNGYQQQNTRYYSKNDNGAQDGRVRGAPM